MRCCIQEPDMNGDREVETDYPGRLVNGGSEKD